MKISALPASRMSFINKTIRGVLANRAVSSAYRRLLRRSPALQDALGMCLYRYRKRAMGQSKSAPPTEGGCLRDAAGVEASAQFLFDISGVAASSDRTGVYRVVSSLWNELTAAPPPGFSVQPVYVDAAGQLRYAFGWSRRARGEGATNAPDPQVSARAGDLFFSADLYYPYPFDTLQRLTEQGLRVIFTVHDLIPLSHPESFMKLSRTGLEEWLHGAVAVADGMVCVSRAVADELRAWVARKAPERHRPLPIGYFHHGADLHADAPPAGWSAAEKQVLDACSARPTFLMVGTLAPHKGHAQTLAAFDLLREQGVDCNLVLVGKEGWRVQTLVDRLHRHPERGHRLFWISNASDSLLTALYGSCACLLAASQAEGFGLPLIEAARHGLPILARDIPVFREVAGQHAFYFRGESPADLACAMRDWLALRASGQLPSSESLPWQTWRESAAQLLHVILNDRWYIPDACAALDVRPPVLLASGKGM